jgi:hypothetical protein
MTHRIVIPATFIAALAGVFIAGRWSVRDHAPAVSGGGSELREHAVPVSAGSPLTFFRRQGVDEEALRRVIREEVGRAVEDTLGRLSCGARASDSTETAKPTRAADSLETPESKAAADGALSVLDAAIARGRWSELDRDEWLSFVSQLSPPAKYEIERRLMVAINKRELSLDPGSLPFGPAWLRIRSPMGQKVK